MNIKEKIKKTGLFTNLEKIELLTSIETFSTETMDKLGKVINDYDDSIKETKTQFKTEITAEFDKLISSEQDSITKEALESIKKGYTRILN